MLRKKSTKHKYNKSMEIVDAKVVNSKKTNQTKVTSNNLKINSNIGKISTNKNIPKLKLTK